MASVVLKQGAKSLVSLPASASLNHVQSMCLRCLSLRALHTRPTEHRFLDYSKKRSSHSQSTIQGPNVHFNRPNKYLGAQRCGIAPAGHSSIIAFDPLQNEIAMATTIDGLFGAVCTNRALLDVTHICSIIKKMDSVVELEPCLQKRKELALLVQKHPEFINLCSVAQHQVGAMTNDGLTDTMQSMLRFLHGGEEVSHPFMRELYAEGSRRLPTLNVQQLAKFAQFISFSYPGQRHVQELELIAHRFSEVLDDFDHSLIQELLALMTATVEVSSGDLQNRVLTKVTEVMHAVVKSKNVFLTGTDISRILTYQWRSYRDCTYSELNKLCSQVIQDHIEKVSVEDLYRVNTTLIHLKDTPIEFFQAVNAELLQRLPTMTDAKDIGLTLELLSRAAREDAAMKFVIEDKVKDLLKGPDAPINSICVALRRIKYIAPTPLLHSLIAYIKQSDLTMFELMPICEYFRCVEEPHRPILEMCELVLNQLIELRDTAISPILMAKIFYCLSLLPPQILESAELDLPSYEELLPQLADRYINLLSIALNRVKFKLKNVPEACQNIEQLLEKVNFRAVCKIDQNESIHHLNNISKYILEEGGGDVVFLEKAMKQYTDKLTQIKSPQIAVKCASILSMAEYLHVPLMDRIAEVVTNKIHWVNPSQVSTILTPFCNLGYDPPNAHEFFQACIDRVVPFLDEVARDRQPNPFYLVSLAFSLSLAQRFPEVLLKKIFSLEFLDKFDAALKGRCDEASNNRINTIYSEGGAWGVHCGKVGAGMCGPDRVPF